LTPANNQDRAEDGNLPLYNLSDVINGQHELEEAKKSSKQKTMYSQNCVALIVVVAVILTLVLSACTALSVHILYKERMDAKESQVEVMTEMMKNMTERIRIDNEMTMETMKKMNDEIKPKTLCRANSCSQELKTCERKANNIASKVADVIEKRMEMKKCTKKYFDVMAELSKLMFTVNDVLFILIKEFGSFEDINGRCQDLRIPGVELTDEDDFHILKQAGKLKNALKNMNKLLPAKNQFWIRKNGNKCTYTKLTENGSIQEAKFSGAYACKNGKARGICRVTHGATFQCRA